MTSRFTPLESNILDALAWDLRDIAPDLAGVLGQALHKPKVLDALTRATRRLGQYEYRPPER